MNNYDLCIALRVYPGMIDAQKVFCDDKFTLYKKSLTSLVLAIGDLKCFIYVILDACPEEYHTFTEKALAEIDHKLIKHNTKHGNAKTFNEQFDLLSNQNYSEYCLFLEDDYLHISKSIEIFVSLMKEKNIDFGTTYNSPDYQKMLIHNYRPELLYFQDKIFGAFGSTTMTFFSTKTSLKKYEKVLLSYSKGNHDFSMWFSMTKLGVFDLGNMIRTLFSSFHQFKLFIYIRYKCFWFILTIPKTKLRSPLLSGSAHIDKKGLPQGIDWQEIWDSI